MKRGKRTPEGAGQNHWEAWRLPGSSTKYIILKAQPSHLERDNGMSQMWK